MAWIEFQHITDELMQFMNKYKSNWKCLYCDNKQTEDLHFVCEDCGDWMCDECYWNLVDHTAHYHEVLDNMEDEKAIKKLQEKFWEWWPTYICEVCLWKHYDD